MPIPARHLVILALSAALAACASARGEMDKYMDSQVGKPIDDPQGFRAVNAKKRVHTSRSRDGKVDEEYLVGFRDGCRIHLTVDEKARTVAGWRYSGTTSDADCISPNIGK